MNLIGKLIVINQLFLFIHKKKSFFYLDTLSKIGKFAFFDNDEQTEFFG